ncbi:MAG: ABC transporter substrate-binding protein [Betaproteobacteria bacterium]
MRPWLAKSWTTSPDRLTVTVNLRPGTAFHDGSKLTGQIVAQILNGTLPRTMGPIFEDVSSLSASADEVRIVLRRPSPLVLEALDGDAPIVKPGNPTIGTGPFKDVGKPPEIQLRANDDYYLGRPSIAGLTIEQYPSVRAAWADLLRNRVDALFEVPTDALDSLEASSNVSVFAVSRAYQYAILLNTSSPALRSAAVRRGLNAAIDRSALVDRALGGHGIESVGPVWVKNWAFDSKLPTTHLDYSQAKADLSTFPRAADGRGKLTIRCLVPADSVYERIALVAKQQLEAFGVELSLEEQPPARIAETVEKHEFEAVLLDFVSGPSLFRPYQWWHTGGPFNFARFSSPAVDAALDRIRHAASDDEYRAGVAAFQRAMLDDPPAIFLAWSQRARAVSNRFLVPPPESGRDILSTIWQWRLRPDAADADKSR